ncbi:hypothetical protein GCK72_015297 [Caenorhabditis remanei]|uniref:Uncharacterized protein n=1 Tax=Caenorhabditis remanei TaxID=31234 RepID=A0A6A5GUH6_CAERE|nr:hypothetical protein GCK72_015297 [Caenorhabditis remanei]KAF1758837.1 hypothetical protein GCK72_015297 [Caenorhabditis remanei]
MSGLLSYNLLLMCLNDKHQKPVLEILSFFWMCHNDQHLHDFSPILFLGAPERLASKSVADSTGWALPDRGVPSKAKELAFRGIPLSGKYSEPDDFSPIFPLDAPDRPVSNSGDSRASPSPDVSERQTSEDGTAAELPILEVPERLTSKSGPLTDGGTAPGPMLSPSG